MKAFCEAELLVTCMADPGFSDSKGSTGKGKEAVMASSHVSASTFEVGNSHEIPAGHLSGGHRYDIASRLEAIASRLEAIAIRLERRNCL